MIGLAFFDPCVDINTKKDMVKNLKHPSKQKALKQQDGKLFDHRKPLSTYVTKCTAKFFNFIITNGKEKAESFLVKKPNESTTDPVYLEMQYKVSLIKNVNDCTEEALPLSQN